jgi:Domain of unknown function (DUF4265)
MVGRGWCTVKPVAGDIVTHVDPAWRSRSNFIIMARIAENSAGKNYEQLFVRKVQDDVFEICCIPYFLYDLSLGDIVETERDDRFAYVVARRLKNCGRFTFRVWLDNGASNFAPVRDRIADLGGQIERHSPRLIAIDSADERAATLIADFLRSEEQASRLVYETGRT